MPRSRTPTGPPENQAAPLRHGPDATAGEPDATVGEPDATVGEPV